MSAPLHPLILTIASRTPAARVSHGGRSSGEGSGLSEELLAREIAGEQAFVDRVYVQLREVSLGRPAAGPGGARARAARPRGRSGRARRDGLPGRAADRPARRRPRGPGLRPPRPAAPSSTADPRYIGRIGLRDDAPRLAADRLARARRPRCSTRPPRPTRRASYAAGCCAAPGRPSSASRTSCSTPRPEADLPIVGEGALMAQLSRARDRSMHSIVATIQAEQDRAIRAPSQGRRVDLRRSRHRQDRGRAAPRGVPALHRPPPLRERRRAGRRPERRVHALHRAGAARRLGETAVALRSLGEVVDGVRATRHDEPAVADVKGSARMAELLRRTARQQAPGAPREFRIFWRDDVIVLDPGQLGRLRRQLMSTGPAQPAAAARRLARCSTRCGARCAASAAASAAARPSTTRCSSTTSLPRLRAGLVAAARRADRARLAARPRASWPGSPTACSPPRSSGCSRSRGRGQSTLSVEDVPLLDELRYALGDVPTRTDDERDARRRPPARGRRRHAGADFTACRPRVRAGRPGLGAAHPPASRTTRSPTCWSTRRRT